MLQATVEEKKVSNDFDITINGLKFDTELFMSKIELSAFHFFNNKIFAEKLLNKDNCYQIM